MKDYGKSFDVVLAHEIMLSGIDLLITKEGIESERLGTVQSRMLGMRVLDGRALP